MIRSLASTAAVRLAAVCFALCPLETAALAQGLALSTNYTAYVAGDKIAVDAHAAPLPQSLDAWAVVLDPEGRIYSMSLSGSALPGAVPLARSVPGLSIGMNARILSMTVPGGIPRGQYAAVLVFLPAGTAPSSVEDAREKAIPGFFTRTYFYVISGKVSIDIQGAWDLTLEEIGKGVMTLGQYSYLVEGAYSGTPGDASILGFIDLDSMTMFMTFAGVPGSPRVTLRGNGNGTTLSGVWESEAFDPSTGEWLAAPR